MKSVQTNVFRPVKVLQNTTKRQATRLEIKCAQSGQVLHIGEPAYIKRIARTKYNVKI